MNMYKRFLLLPIIALSILMHSFICAVVLNKDFTLASVPNVKSASVLPIGIYNGEVYAILSREVGGKDKKLMMILVVVKSLMKAIRLKLLHESFMKKHCSVIPGLHFLKAKKQLQKSIS